MARKTKAKETIPAVEVGADAVEQALKDNPELPTEFVEEALKATQEVVNGEVMPYTSPSEAITDVLEEKAANALPEGENVPSEATDSLELIPDVPELEEIQEDIKISLKHVELHSLVKDILYISSLGGEIPFGNYTNLRRFPYQAEMTLPYTAKEAWENRPEETPHEKSYTVNLSYLDANIFANKLVELGKKGAKLDGGVLTTGMMQAKLKMFVPIAEEKPNVVVGLDKFRYTREELHLLDYVSLKALGSWYGVRVGAKAGLIKAILDKQAEVNWV